MLNHMISLLVQLVDLRLAYLLVILLLLARLLLLP